MTKLPAILASEFCTENVEDIPFDIRKSALEAIDRITANPEKFPNADWDYIHRKHEAILSVAFAWLQN